MSEPDAQILRAYSAGAMSAHDARRRLGDCSYADLLIALAAQNLPLPRAPLAGREATVERARQWLFHPDDVAA